jgi:O-antigen/teichoic acid export membrane protein
MEPVRAALSPLQFIRNLVYLSGAEVAGKIVTFAAVAYVARVAGPVTYGYVEYAAAVLLCANLVVDQGFGPYGAREIAKRPVDTPVLVTEVVTARVLLAIGAYALVIVPTALTARSPVITQLLLWYGLSLLATPLLLQWVFQGHDRMGVAAVTQLVRQSVYAVVVFLVVRTAADVWSVTIAEIAGVIAAGAYGVWMLRRLAISAPPLRPKLSRRLFREGVPIGLSQLFWMVKMFGATLIVGAIALPLDVGLFAGAQRILVALHAFVFLYYFNLLPSLARTWREDPSAFAAITLRSLKCVLWLSLLAGVGWVLLAPLGMSLAYGSAFEPGGTTLQWLGLMWVVAAISGHYRFGLIAAGRQKAEMMTSVVGAVVTLALIPVGYFWLGLNGTGVALVIAEVAVWLSAWWWARRTLSLQGHARVLVRPAIGAALALGAAWLAPLVIELRVAVAWAVLAGLALALEPEVRRPTFDLLALIRRMLPIHSSQHVQEVA